MEKKEKVAEELKRLAEEEPTTKEELIAWVKKHKRTLIEGVAALGAATVIVILVKENSELRGKLGAALKENNLKDLRIDELTKLCVLKDEYFKAMIADGLRHGSSEAARQMAYLKDINR